MTFTLKRPSENLTCQMCPVHFWRKGLSEQERMKVQNEAKWRRMKTLR
jgi:hypothetical protein